MNDFFPGDPARHVMGREEERPARRHAPQRRKPEATPLVFEERLLRDIRARKDKLKKHVDEVPRLMEALEALEKINKKGKK